MVRNGYSYDTEEQAIAAQDQVDEVVGLPAGGNTLNHSDIFFYDGKWILEHSQEAEELFGMPEVFEITTP